MKKYYFNCPKCGQDEKFYRVGGSGRSILMSGPMYYLLGTQKTGITVKCSKCGEIFEKPPLPSSRIAKVCGYLCMALLILIVIISGYLVINPIGANAEPEWMLYWEEYINTHVPRWGAYLIILAPVLVVISPGIISNIIYHRKLRQKFEYRAKMDS